MQNVPQPGSRFFAPYQVASDWCSHVPDGQDHDDCIVGSLGTIANQQQYAADRVGVLETAFLVVVLIGIVLLVRRRISARWSL